MNTEKLIKRLELLLNYTDGTSMGAIIASDKIKSLIKRLRSEQKLNIHSVIKSVCPLCDGKGRRVFPNCNPPIDEVCPACKGQTVL